MTYRGMPLFHVFLCLPCLSLANRSGGGATLTEQQVNNKTSKTSTQCPNCTAHVAWREIWAFVTLKVPIMITVFVNSACWTIRCDKNTLSKVSPFDRKSKRIQDISRLLSQMKRPFHVVTEGVNLILKNCFSHGKGQVQARFITSSPVVRFGWDFGGVLGDQTTTTPTQGNSRDTDDGERRAAVVSLLTPHQGSVRVTTASFDPE